MAHLLVTVLFVLQMLIKIIQAVLINVLPIILLLMMEIKMYVTFVMNHVPNVQVLRFLIALSALRD